MYLDFYGLREAPFSITPDPRFVFLSERHRDALAHLLYGIGQGGGGGFVQLTGEVGTGKTTLCRLLLEQLPDNVRVALVLNPRLTPIELLQSIAEELKIDLPGRRDSLKALVDALNAFLIDAYARGLRVVLIVDEAQNLSPRAVEELRMLSNFQIGTQSLVQSFLVGQPEFREIMQRPEMRQLKQRVIASYHLGPLEENETRGYIEHRLRRVGWTDRPTFADGVFERIFSFTQGVPRRINTLCDRLLLATYLAERVEINPPDVDLVAAELGEELGGPALDGPRASSAAMAHAAHRALTEANATMAALNMPSVGLLDSEHDAAELEAPEGTVSERLAQLEERMALVEASTNLTYGVLKKVLRVLRSKNEVVRK